MGDLTYLPHPETELFAVSKDRLRAIADLFPYRRDWRIILDTELRSQSPSDELSHTLLSEFSEFAKPFLQDAVAWIGRYSMYCVDVDTRPVQPGTAQRGGAWHRDEPGSWGNTKRQVVVSDLLPTKFAVGTLPSTHPLIRVGSRASNNDQFSREVSTAVNDGSVQVVDSIECMATGFTSDAIHASCPNLESDVDILKAFIRVKGQ